RWNAVELAAETFLHCGQELVETPRIEHVFQPRLVAVGAIAVIDEDAHDRVRDRGCILGRNDDAGVAGEILVPGDAAERETKPHAGRYRRAVADLNGLEADVVGVLECRDRAGPVESDVELA